MQASTDMIEKKSMSSKPPVDFSKIEVVNLEDFREMQGILGSFYISEQIFKVMVRLRDKLSTNTQNAAAMEGTADYENFITLEDYLVYNDVSFYGSEDEKNSLTFMMLDQEGTGQVTLR